MDYSSAGALRSKRRIAGIVRVSSDLAYRRRAYKRIRDVSTISRLRQCCCETAIECRRAAG